MATQSKTLKADSETLELSSGNRKASLTAEQLKQWVQEQSKPKAEISHKADDKDLSRFGLKNASDVIAFLKSPAGHSVFERIAEDLAFEAAIAEQERIKAQDKETRKRRLLAYMMYILAIKKARAKIIEHNQIMQQIDLQLKKDPNTESSLFEQSKIDILSAYDESIEELQEELKNTQHELIDIDKQLQFHEHQLQEISEKHHVYHESLDAMDNETLALEKTAEPIKHLEMQLKTLEQDIHKTMDEVSELIESNQEKQASSKLHRLNCLHFKSGQIQDMLDAKKGEKQLYDNQGNQVSDLSQATFVIPQKMASQKQLLVHNGETYLLPQNTVFDNLSAEEKLQAKQDFEKLKNQLIVVPKLVRAHMQLERNFHEQTTTSLAEQKRALQSHSENLKNEIKSFTQVRLEMSQTLSNSNELMTESPKMKPSTIASPQIGSTYKIIHFLKENEPKMTRERIMALGQDSEQARNFIRNQLAMQPATGPLPHMTIVTMLQHLERMGVDATKPPVTNVQNPRELKAEAEKPFNPSPFSMRPGNTVK